MSEIARAKIPIPQLFRDFYTALFGPSKHEGSCEYISLGSSENDFRTDCLIVRPCYRHLLPQIHNKVLKGGKPRPKVAVTGMPGIGKSVFGVFLVRHYVLRKETVVYVEQDNIWMFSFDPAAVDLFALEPFVQMDETSMCYAGYWSTSYGSNTNLQPLFTSGLDAIVIHDPEMGDHRIRRMEGAIPRLVYILSHGHDLITHWATKGKSPRKYYLPLWSKRWKNHRLQPRHS